MSRRAVSPRASSQVDRRTQILELKALHKEHRIRSRSVHFFAFVCCLTDTAIVLSQGQRENNDLVAASARPPHERWLPNREQLAVLEDLYSKGTMPSQENIAEIVDLVDHDHGPVSESKVYFWFQNKKARERRQRRRIEEANAASGACASAIATTAAASASSGKSSAEDESMNHIISIGFSFPALLAKRGGKK
ncbi:hypothetical protein SELMODRAFT_84885 [Selaginella moellendorffii]|uniref:Uncharacterized protein WOX1-1 n=1 Tax=Selaginella moellendorffii TaxID=88036 RepID=D8R3W4_SELML|nr:hypothetical protein SELMODRAFT_84885 [Selaginella moellendorffii]